MGFLLDEKGRYAADTYDGYLPRSAIQTVSSAYTILGSDFAVMCNATGGGFTVTLPPASILAGQQYFIKKIDSSSNVVTVDGNGAETIDDATTVLLPMQYDCIHVICDGTEWWII
jgi:hypothetical protein